MINNLEKQVLAKIAQANSKRAIKPLDKSVLHELILMQQISTSEQIKMDQ